MILVYYIFFWSKKIELFSKSFSFGKSINLFKLIKFFVGFYLCVGVNLSVLYGWRGKKTFMRRIIKYD